MTVESEVPTDILIVDIEMTKRTGITHDTVEGIDGHLGKRRKLSLGGKYEKTRPYGTIVCVTTYLSKTSIHIVITLSLKNLTVEEHDCLSNYTLRADRSASYFQHIATFSHETTFHFRYCFACNGSSLC